MKTIDKSILKIKEIGDTNNIIIDEVNNLNKIKKISSLLFLNSNIKAHQKDDPDFKTIAESINYIENMLSKIINNLNIECKNNKYKIEEITIALEELNSLKNTNDSSNT